MKGIQITRGSGRARNWNTIRETLKKILEINELDKDMIDMIEHYGVVWSM
jgi:hypothetical protein